MGEKPAFPPDAFALDSRLLSLLSALPETSGKGALGLFPFPEFTESRQKDYTGRTIEECLEAVRIITGMELPIAAGISGLNTPLLGRSFWQALIRGGYQGAVYYIDSLGNKGICAI